MRFLKIWAILRLVTVAAMFKIKKICLNLKRFFKIFYKLKKIPIVSKKI